MPAVIPNVSGHDFAPDRPNRLRKRIPVLLFREKKREPEHFETRRIPRSRGEE